jgi:hypothetical protein
MPEGLTRVLLGSLGLDASRQELFSPEWCEIVAASLKREHP